MNVDAVLRFFFGYLQSYKIRQLCKNGCIPRLQLTAVRD
jgi:hypothetical protein